MKKLYSAISLLGLMLLSWMAQVQQDLSYQYAWHKQLATTVGNATERDNEQLFDLQIDAQGNVFASGQCHGGNIVATTLNVNFPTNTGGLISLTGSLSPFLVAYDQNGGLKYTKVLTGFPNQNLDEGNSSVSRSYKFKLSPYSSALIYTTSSVLNGGNINQDFNFHGSVAKLNKDTGALQWYIRNTFRGTTGTHIRNAYAIELDAQENVYVGGSMGSDNGFFQFKGSDNQLKFELESRREHGYLYRLNPTGTTYDWRVLLRPEPLNLTFNSAIKSSAYDEAENKIITAGWFSGTVDFSV